MMASKRAWIGRSTLLVAGLGVGAGLLYQTELSYRVHETAIMTRPIFDPPGIKYAQVQHPDAQACSGSSPWATA